MKTRSRFAILLVMLLAAGNLLKADVTTMALYNLQKNWALRDSLGFVCVYKIGPWSYVKLMSFKYMTKFLPDGSSIITGSDFKLKIAPLGITEGMFSPTLQAIINAPYGVITTYVPDDTTLEAIGTGPDYHSRLKTKSIPVVFSPGDTTPSVSSNSQSFKTANVTPVTIRGFKNMAEGRWFKLVFGDGLTTITNNDTLATPGGIDLIFNSGDIAEFWKLGGVVKLIN